MRGISSAISLARSGRPPQPGLRILMYHAVGSMAEQDRLGIYSIPPELFRRQISVLAASYRGQFADLAKDLPTDNHPHFAVTFDDGYRDNLYCAAPLLLEHGIPFSVFVCSGFIRNKSSGYLTEQELRELASLKGVTIGAHGATHMRLTNLDACSLREELVTSKNYLEQITGRPISSLSYPHGAVNRRVRDAAEDAGYTLGACSRFDINSPTRDRLVLCRTDILGIDSVAVFKQKLRGDWDWYRWRTADVFT